MAKKPKSPIDLDALYHKVRNMPAAIDPRQMEGIEANFQRDPFGVARRTALAVLTQPCDEMFAKIDADRSFAEAMAAAHESIKDYTETLEELLEAMQGARLRIAVGLCNREDMDDVFAAARQDELLDQEARA